MPKAKGKKKNTQKEQAENVNPEVDLRGEPQKTHEDQSVQMELDLWTNSKEPTKIPSPSKLKNSNGSKKTRLEPVVNLDSSFSSTSTNGLTTSPWETSEREQDHEFDITFRFRGYGTQYEAHNRIIKAAMNLLVNQFGQDYVEVWDQYENRWLYINEITRKLHLV